MNEKLVPNRETIRIFWQAMLACNTRWQLVLSALYPIGALLLTIGAPYYIGRIIAGISLPDGDPYHYVPHLLIVSILGIVANRYGFQHVLTVQARAMSYIQKQAFEALTSRSVGFHNDNVGGKLVSDSIDYPSAFSSLSDAVFTNLAPFVLTLFFGATIVFIESWQLGIVISFMVAYAVGSGIYDTQHRKPLRLKRLTTSKAVTAHLADAILNIQTVKTFARELHEHNTHHKLNAELADVRIRDWSRAAREGNNRIIVLLVLQLVFIAVLITVAKRDPSILHIGIFAFSFITMISIRLFQINIMLRQIEDGFLNASPMTEILLQQPEIKDIPDAQKLQVHQGTIELDDVGFSYSDAKRNNHVFRHLSLKIKPGEKVGLVGPSGGGKSTLTRLLLRFEDIAEGTISIDNQDVSKVTQESLRRAIAYVPQEPLLFHRTIAENISYGRPDASLKEIERAAKQAYAHHFIKELSDGYQTIVGERGVKLSGGQRQRIAIARAILKDAPILLLDEATSALDSESEVYIQKALWELMQGRTTLVIAHRLSTVQKMDRIIVLVDGKITEQGSHKTLIEQNGTYAKLWAHQSGGFIEE